MNIEMLFYMETEDDDEPLTEQQWKNELNGIILDTIRYIKKRHRTYVKNVDGEFATEEDGQYKFKRK